MLAASERERLRARLAEAGYTPGRRDLVGLIALVVLDEDTARVRRALLRAPAPLVAAAAAAALPDAPDDAGARLATILGDAASADPAVAPSVAALLDDPRSRVQRAAATALGKLGGDLASAALCARWDRGELDPPLRRALTDALGKVGGAEAEQRLRATSPGDDRELARRRDRALLIAVRDAADDRGAIIIDRPPPAATVMIARCRAGLEPLLAAELADAGLRPHRLGVGQVMVDVDAPLATVAEARTLLTAGAWAPLADASPEAIAAAVATLVPVMTAWTDGAITWRLDFAGAGHRRALTWATAAAVDARSPALRNQPRSPRWDIVVAADERGLEARPRLPERFAWRVAEIPAASHPTIAAALARVAAPGPDASAWDPFVGSGGELCELARLTDGALYGGDLDPRSLAAADANLRAAGARARTELRTADALTDEPPPVDLIITNPPMGMRLRGDVPELLTRFANRVPARLTRRGALVWLTPAANRTGPALAASGLRRTFARPVDLGGHEVMLERWAR